MARLDLPDVCRSGGQHVLDAYHYEHEADEQNDVLHNPVHQRNDYKSGWGSIAEGVHVLHVELVVEVVNVDASLKHNVERDKYSPGQQIVPRHHVNIRFVAEDEEKGKDEEDEVKAGEGDVQLECGDLLAVC